MVVKQSETFETWLGEIGGLVAFAALAEMSDAAVFVVDSNRRVIFWSDGAKALLGYDREEVVGQSCRESNRCAQCMVGCGLMEHGVLENVPLVLYSREGNATGVRKAARAFHDAEGRFLGGIEVLTRDDGALNRMQNADDAMEWRGIVTRSEAMKAVIELVKNVAETDATVLVRGESGTGKELVARAIHDASHRTKGPFVAINCAALSPELLESELFGHEKGAFTGAIRNKQGLFERAHGGTLFLDELAEMPLDLQAKLLRVLEERAVTPVGSTESRKVDVRVISATHRSLRERVAAGVFREDLMFRLRVVPLFIPPLRERRRDVELLAWHFISAFNEKGPRQVDRVSPEAMRLLLDHGWPGNVRELRNVLEYALAVGRGPELGAEQLPREFQEARAGQTPVVAPVEPAAKGDAAAQEAAAVRSALEQAGGQVGRAAQILGVSRATFWRLRKKHGIAR